MQLVSLYDNQNVGDIVRSDYRTAGVFREYGINYCCKGNFRLREVCSAKNVSYAEVVLKLNQVSQTANLPLDLQFDKWKTDFLIDYIVNIHHAYLKQTLPQLEGEMHYLVNHRKNEYPQLQTAMSIHSAICVLMDEEHRQQEEVLFPYIKQIYSAHRRQEPYGGLLVRTLRKPMKAPGDNHDQLNEYLTSLRQLTDNYRVSHGRCTRYDILMQRLRELDNQLVLHKHLENNILFPAAIVIEQDLLKA
ncbi:MAG: DUF542 domain-containing protein [Chitinophagaceae bacterium]|nr:DUF542 domain-containing protein [Chitinophagaceae bacterium]